MKGDSEQTCGEISTFSKCDSKDFFLNKQKSNYWNIISLVSS